MNAPQSKPLYHSEEGQAIQSRLLAEHFKSQLKVAESLKKWRAERNAIIAKRREVHA